METWSAKPQLPALLDHLGRVKDTRQSWKVAYPLREVYPDSFGARKTYCAGMFFGFG